MTKHLWALQAAPVREKLATLREEADPDRLEQLNVNLLRFVHAAFAGDPTATIRDDIDPEALRRTFSEELLRFVPEDIPSYITLQQLAKGPTLSRMQPSRVLLPFEIAVALDRHGLVDGQEKSLQNVAAAFGVKKQRVSQISQDVQKRLKRTPTIRTLVVAGENPIT